MSIRQKIGKDSAVFVVVDILAINCDYVNVSETL